MLKKSAAEHHAQSVKRAAKEAYCTKDNVCFGLLFSMMQSAERLIKASYARKH